MGLSLSCLHYGPLHERLLAFFWNLADFNHGNSNVSGQTPILRALGSGKMLIERSLSLKRMEGGKKEHLSRRASLKSSEYDSPEMVLEPTTPQPSSPKHEAAIKLQKVYKSFRTRRQLADCAVLVEQRWWKLLDFALLKRSSVSFFDHDRPETVVSRWSRARMRAAKVGKGLSKDAKAQKLALQHWLEAIDPRHRYGHNLHFYYLSWLECKSKQPFFYWLDVGEGKEVNLQHCPRSKLQQQCIKYLGPKEREAYEVIVEDGKLIYKQNRQLLDSSSGFPGLKWIFVLSTSKNLYVGQKKKGVFQHSSFLAGGATSSAGRLVVEKGILKAVWPHSGHYRPTEENFQEFVSFLTENNVDLSDVKKSPMEDDEESWGRSESSSHLRRILSCKMSSKHLRTVSYDKIDSEQPSEVQPRHAYDGQENDLGPICDMPKKSFTAELRDFNAVNIQNVYKGSEGETDEDIDDNGGGTKSGEGSDSANTTEEARHLQETALHGNEEVEARTSSRQRYMFHKKNLFEEDHDEDGEQHIPKELILQRINSTKRTKSLQLGRQWSSGVGPRIGCVRDYPSQLQFQALEQVNLSPRTTKHLLLTCSTPRTSASSTPRALGTSLQKHHSLDSTYCT